MQDMTLKKVRQMIEENNKKRHKIMCFVRKRDEMS